MEKDIGKITKNDTSDIVIRIDDFGGRKGLTIREFVTSERYTGFTKQGVRIGAADFPKFKEMINSITEADLKDDGTSSSGGESSSVAPSKDKGKPKKEKEPEIEEEVIDY